MKKEIAVDFFKVVIESLKPVLFEGLVESVSSAPDDESRNRTINRCPVRLKKVEFWEDCVIGEMVRLRVTEAAIKGSRSGKLARISMENDEYLSGLTAFLYHPRSKLLCLERNRSGVGPGTVAKYFRSAGGLDGAMELRVIIEPETLRRMTAMTEYKALEVRIATFESMAALRKDVPSVAGAIQMAKSFEAPFIDFTLSMGHVKGGLTRGVIDAVSELLRKRSEDPREVTKVRVIGRDPGADTTEPIDLIAHRVKHEDHVELSHDPDESFRERAKVLKRAWHQKRSAVQALSQSAL